MRVLRSMSKAATSTANTDTKPDKIKNKPCQHFINRNNDLVPYPTDLNIWEYVPGFLGFANNIHLQSRAEQVKIANSIKDQVVKGYQFYKIVIVCELYHYFIATISLTNSPTMFRGDKNFKLADVALSKADDLAETTLCCDAYSQALFDTHLVPLLAKFRDAAKVWANSYDVAEIPREFTKIHALIGQTAI